jgi:hypothetical protein
MQELDARLVLSAGGWDTRYGLTLAVASNGDVGGALIDTNGDEADIDLDEYERDAEGNWHEMGSGSAGEAGASRSTRMSATWGRADPHAVVEIEYLGQRHSTVASETGWWLFVVPATDDSDAVPRWIDQRR